MTRRDIDLLLMVASSLVLTAIILAVPSAKAARIIIGLPFVLFFPGYTLAAALFPRKDDLEAIERAALSLGLSIAVVPLIGLALNYSPWGIRLNPILVFVTLFISLAAAAAFVRRRPLPDDEAFGVAINIQLPRWSQVRLVDRLLAVGMVIALVALGVTAYFVATSRGSSESFTEFYVLGPGGKAEAYPTLMKVGENATVILGVINQEGEDTTYQVAVRIDGENMDSIGNLSLADDERWEERVAIVPTHAGDDQKVEFLLYKDGGSEPYRSLHLRMDVEGALAEAPAIEVRPSPTPAASPTATPPPQAETPTEEQAPTPAEESPVAAEPPQYRVHIVAPGENLTGIAKRYGVPLNEVIAANELENPNLIYPKQEILMPTSNAPGESE